MTRRMNAFRLLDWQAPPQLVEVAVPKPGPGEVLVKVAGNGLCHSDIGMMQMPKAFGEMVGWQMPFTLGHEAAGWVDSWGDGVKGLTVGEPVVVVSNHSDGSCVFCLRGHDNACVEGHFGRGYGRDGGLADYLLVSSARELIKLTTIDPKTAGPLTDAGATSYHAVKRVLPKLVPGSTAVVYGVGGLGSFAVQFLKVMSPARIIAVDNNPVRRAVATEFGAHEVLHGVDAGTTEAVKKLTKGFGAEVVLDFVGTDDTIASGLAATRKTGSYALIGAGGGMLKQPWWQAFPKDGEIFAFQGGTILDITEVIALVEAGLVRNEIELFPLSRVAEAYEKLDRGELRGRAVIAPD